MSIVDASYGVFKDIFDTHILPNYLIMRWMKRFRSARIALCKNIASVRFEYFIEGLKWFRTDLDILKYNWPELKDKDDCFINIRKEHQLILEIHNIMS